MLGAVIMNNLKKSANILYNLFNIFFFLAIFALCASVIASALFFIMDVTADTIQLGILEFSLNSETLDSQSLELKFIMLTQMFSIALGSIFAAIICKRLKGIMLPIKNGDPFIETISADVRKLGNTILVFGICSTVSQVVLTIAFALFLGKYSYIFQNDYILSCKIISTSDFGGWIAAALVVYLLAYIFEYGMQLQKLSNETL